MVAKNCANWNIVSSLDVNGDHRHPPIQPSSWKAEFRVPDLELASLPYASRDPPLPEVMDQSGTRRTTRSARERLSLEWTRDSGTSNAFKVLPAGLPNGTRYPELLKSESRVSLAEPVGALQTMVTSTKPIVRYQNQHL